MSDLGDLIRSISKQNGELDRIRRMVESAMETNRCVLSDQGSRDVLQMELKCIKDKLEKECERGISEYRILERMLNKKEV